MEKKKIQKNNPTNQWFKLDANMPYRQDVVQLRMKHGWKGYGLFIAILCHLRVAPGHELPFDIKPLVYSLRVSSRLIVSVIKDFGLFVLDQEREVFYNQELSDFMQEMHNTAEKNSVNGKKGALARYGKTPQLPENNDVSVTEVENPF